MIASLRDAPDGMVFPSKTNNEDPAETASAVFSDHDRAAASGMGGQQAVQKGAVVNHYLGAYIRELGFRATNSQADPLSLAQAASLGRAGANGRLITRAKAAHVHFAGVVVTDLPLVANEGFV